MKTIFVVAAVVAVLVPSAFAAGQARDPRVPKLQSQVRQLQTAVGALQAFRSCFKDMVPVGVYGNETAGYVYQYGPNDMGTTSALDVSGQGDEVGDWLATVDQRCVQPNLRRTQANTTGRKSQPIGGAAWSRKLDSTR